MTEKISEGLVQADASGPALSEKFNRTYAQLREDVARVLAKYAVEAYSGCGVNCIANTAKWPDHFGQSERRCQFEPNFFLST